jgi:hypothetical protein
MLHKKALRNMLLSFRQFDKIKRFTASPIHLIVNQFYIFFGDTSSNKPSQHGAFEIHGE